MQVWKYRTQKWCQKSPSACARSHNFVGLYIRNYGTYRQSEKNSVKQQYVLHTSSQYGELWPTNGWDLFGSLRHPSKFQRVARLALVTAATSLSGGQKLCTMFGRLLGWYTIYTFLGALAPDKILPGTKFALLPSLAFAYIGSVTARHSSSGRQPNFAVWYNEWNYGTFTEGSIYIRHRPTF